MVRVRVWTRAKDVTMTTFRVRVRVKGALE